MLVCKAYKDSEVSNEIPFSNAQDKWRFSMRLLVIMAVIMKNVGTRKLGSFKALVSFCHSTQRHISEDRAFLLFTIVQFRINSQDRSILHGWRNIECRTVFQTN